MNPPAARRGLILAAVCLAAFAINVDTTIVNVALPSLTRQLGAGTRDLQWIVDGYNLAFPALVLSAGSLGDRFGRRPALITGLLGFAAASAAAALCSSPGQLVAARFVMGAFAALIFPTTLAVMRDDTKSSPGGMCPASRNSKSRSASVRRKARARASTTCAEGEVARPCSSRVR